MIKHNKHICEQLTAQYWDRTGLSNKLSLILITAERISYFLTLEYCTLCCTFIFRQQQREFILWCNLFPLQTLSSSAHVYLCNYLWIIHAQILQSSLIISFCIHNSESTHTNTQIKPAINKPEVSHSNKIKEQQQKNWQWGKISSSHSYISPRGYAIFTSLAVIYLFWLKPTSTLPASPWQNGWHRALSSHTQLLTGQTTRDSLNKVCLGWWQHRHCHSTHTGMFPVFSVASLTLPRHDCKNVQLFSTGFAWKCPLSSHSTETK